MKRRTILTKRRRINWAMPLLLLQTFYSFVEIYFVPRNECLERNKELLQRLGRVSWVLQRRGHWRGGVCYFQTTGPARVLANVLLKPVIFIRILTMFGLWIQFLHLHTATVLYKKKLRNKMNVKKKENININIEILRSWAACSLILFVPVSISFPGYV